MSNIIIAIGALVIFSVFLASSNRLMTGNTRIAEQNEYYICAVSLGQSLIDEAKSKAFDEKTVSNPVGSPASLSAVLGPDGILRPSELLPSPDTITSASPYTSSARGYLSKYRFDDVDDYNGYKRLVNTPRAEGFLVTCAVGYASPSSPDSPSGIPTFCKKMTVQVTSPYMADTIKLSYAFTY